MKVSFDRYPKRVRHQLTAAMAVLAVLIGFIAPWISGIFMVAMAIVLIQRLELTLDLDRRTYVINRGFNRRTGTFANLKGIEIDRRTTATSENPTSPPRYVVSLRWVNDREFPWELANSLEIAEAMSDAQYASQRFLLPLFEGPRLIDFRREFEKAQSEFLKI